MQSGKLRSLITYRERVQSDQDGQRLTTGFTTYGPFYARIITPSGREVTNAGQQVATYDRVIEWRWPGFDPKPTGQIVHGTEVYEIVWTNNVDSRNAQLFSYCIFRPKVKA